MPVKNEETKMEETLHCGSPLVENFKGGWRCQNCGQEFMPNPPPVGTNMAGRMAPNRPTPAA